MLRHNVHKPRRRPQKLSEDKLQQWLRVQVELAPGGACVRLGNGVGDIGGGGEGGGVERQNCHRMALALVMVLALLGGGARLGGDIGGEAGGLGHG